jgi:hypothetical protein
MKSIFTASRKLLACALNVILVLMPTLDGIARSQTPAPQAAPNEAVASTPASSSYQGQGAPATAQELQNLVAPMALYPDALVAQILSASTFPDQVGAANYWLQQNKTLTGSAILP